MPTVLITGAGRGIGWEFARQYAGDGWDVIATCRNPAAESMLADLGSRVSVYEADMRNADDLERLSAKIGNRPIDIMILNAATDGPRANSEKAFDREVWGEVMSVNVVAPLQLVDLFANNVAASREKTIVALSSELGSVGGQFPGGKPAYRASKAALNNVMRRVSGQLAKRGIVTLIVHPGWVRAGLGSPDAPVAVADSVGGMRRLIDRAGPLESGRFFAYDGAELPW